MNRWQAEKYWSALFMAEYYRWCALRGHQLAGNNPADGRPYRPRGPCRPGPLLAAARRPDPTRVQQERLNP